MPKPKKDSQGTPAPRQSLATLLDKLLVDLKLKNDAALARVLECKQPDVSKMRHGMAIAPRIILMLHEKARVPVWEIRSHIKDMPA